MKSSIPFVIPLSLFPAMTVGFSASSSFAGSMLSTANSPQLNSYAWSMYNDERKNDSADHNAWSVLANTEKWISDTLKTSNSGNPNNPYARKEVSYVCENQSSSPMVISNLFKWLKNARKDGEKHRESELIRSEEQGESYKPSTLRQTQVVVIPSCSEFASFPVFDTLLQTVNQARRNARDYVTTDLDEDEDDVNAWSVAINCAHMHPKYGEKTPEQELAELKEEEENGEVDLNLQAYQQVRLAARRSPYPSVVIEVRASPAPDFGGPPPAVAEQKGQVSPSDIQQLEALFGKSAAIKEKDPETSFWDQIGSRIEEVSAVTPVRLAEEWIARTGDTTPAAFTESSTTHVDSAYQFVFANVAMLQEQNNVSTYYIVLPNFLTSAATSFEKFSSMLSELLEIAPNTRGGKFKISTFHPEHVDPERRSPCPILTLRK